MRLRLITLLISATMAHTPQAQEQFKTTVDPLPNENPAGSCVFEFSLPAPHKPVRAVWVTYDRGFDISRFYQDEAVMAFARAHGLALMLAHQCPAKDPPTGEHGEMDMDLSRGTARSIYAALDSFAKQSEHPEIASAKLILLGFSGIGAMFAHFLRHQNRGARWVFLVQNEIPHCCVINAKGLVLEWLGEVLRRDMRQMHHGKGWNGFIRQCEGTAKDSWKLPLSNACDAAIRQTGEAAPANETAVGGSQRIAWPKTGCGSCERNNIPPIRLPTGSMLNIRSSRSINK